MSAPAVPAPNSTQRVLIVDDQLEIIELLGEYLRARGYDVMTATDGATGLDVVRGGDVDLVLTDMKMPHMGGLELLDAIRELRRPVATIIMTGFATVDTAIRAMKQGAFDYLLKPFKLRDVYAALVRASERLRLERAAAGMRDLLDYYEACNAAEDRGALDPLCEHLARVALFELHGRRAAVWRGGSLVAQVGDGDALDALDIQGLDGVRRQGDWVVAPFATGAVAVAGPAQGTDDARLLILARGVDATIRRLGG